jgi:hypothetical protein
MNVEEALTATLRRHKQLTIACIVAVPVVVWLVLNALWPASGILWWLSFFFIANVFTHIAQRLSLTVLLSVLAFKVGDAIDLGDGIDEVERQSLVIVDTPDDTIGTFKGTEFFEWLDLADKDQVVHRAEFSGIVNLDEEIVVPPRCIVLPPGLLYELSQDVEQVNTPTVY